LKFSPQMKAQSGRGILVTTLPTGKETRYLIFCLWALKLKIISVIRKNGIILST
jgi:hypothetical protein